MMIKRLLPALALGASLVLFCFFGLSSPNPIAEAQNPSGTIDLPSLARPYDPVVITGGQVSSLIGTPLAEIFVYAYDGASSPGQIPSQIDERTSDGFYLLEEDGLFDENDELVFMAAEVGAKVLTPTLSVGTETLTATSLITIVDPLGGIGWVYLFHSTAISRTNVDYVDYDSGAGQLVGSGVYTLHFNPVRGSRDDLFFAGAGQDILTREELEARLRASLLSVTLTEENLTQDSLTAIDGAVRVTLVGTQTFSTELLGEQVKVSFGATFFAYQTMTLLPTRVGVGNFGPIQITVDHFRYSLNLNNQASGMTYYDANTPAGVIVDGVTDPITKTPLSTWNQVTGLSGTLINVYSLPEVMSGTRTTYYVDQVSSDDYGNAGFHVENPEIGSYEVLGYSYYLPGERPNIGATYADYVANPLQVVVGQIKRGTVDLPPVQVYLPLLLKS